MNVKCLVLDAMGVIFQAGDDVAELLVPFLEKNGGSRDVDYINQIYFEASSGKMSAKTFWHTVGVDPILENSYLDLHALKPGIMQLLQSCQENDLPVWCLSNDLAQWSEKIRAKFGLETYFKGAVISGEAGCRKPDQKIYQILMERCGFQADEILFVDDRQKNIDMARKLGINTLLCSENSEFHQIAELLSFEAS